MNKMFTAVAVLQLAQVGKIKLSDPLGKYLSDYPNKELASKVTIHHLLTHTGGTGDFFGPEFDKHQLELRSLFTVLDRKSTRLNSSHGYISYAVFCLKKKTEEHTSELQTQSNLVCRLLL